MILSVLGAAVMYIMSMISLFVLRKKNPGCTGPSKCRLYPWFPAIALVLSIVALLAIMYYNRWLSLLFFGGLAIALVIFVAMGKHREAEGKAVILTEG